MMRLSLVVVVLVLAGCASSNSVSCGDYVCPQGNVCVTSGCATPEEASACSGMLDGTSCAVTAGVGTCEGGACRRGTCGDGIVEGGEACDDGNRASGDGCRADCAKIEMCGDSVVDANEACDDANSNPADGCDMCRKTAWTPSVIVGEKISAAGVDMLPSAVVSDGNGRLYIADNTSERVWRFDPDGAVVLVAGNGIGAAGADGIPATATSLFNPAALAVDGFGRLLIADASSNRVRRIDASGVITTIAGTGTPGFSGDGGPATAAQLSGPMGVAIDPAGIIYISDSYNNRIRRVALDGKIDTIAGTASSGFAPDNTPATTAALSRPEGIAIDAMNRVVFADDGNNVVRRFAVGGNIATVPAGTLQFPSSVAIDNAGDIYVNDVDQHRIQRVTPTGVVTTVAGTFQTPGYAGDGGPATSAQLDQPGGICVDETGRLVIADTLNARVRRVDATGVITTAVGTGAQGDGPEGGGASSSLLIGPYGVAVDPMGRVLIADQVLYNVFRIELDGDISRVAGIGIGAFSGDAGPAVNAALYNPTAIATDTAGNIVIADRGNNRIRRIDTTGTITTIAGKDIPGYSGDGGPATSAGLGTVAGLAYDNQGRLVISDQNSHRVRRISTTGVITTIAGNGTQGYTGDNGPATSATVGAPAGIATDAQGNVFFVDQFCECVRKIDATGNITTIAGTGTGGSSGDGGLATSARLESPDGIALDAAGRLYIADSGNNKVRMIDTAGMMHTFAGTGTDGFLGDGGSATSAQLSNPVGVAVASTGVIVSDLSYAHVRQIDANGIITTIAGRVDPPSVGPVAHAFLGNPVALVVTPTVTFTAGGNTGVVEAIRAGQVDAVIGRYPQSTATGTFARYRTNLFGSVNAIAYDSTGGIMYVAESDRIWKVLAADLTKPDSWMITTLTGSTAGFADGAAASAKFRSPSGLWLDATDNTLYVADTGNHAIRTVDLSSNQVATIVNTKGKLGFSGDGGSASDATLNLPTGITQCNGQLFIADTENQRVRRVDASGMIATVAGTGVADSSGEGTPASDFPLDHPRGLACDAIGNLYISSRSTVRILPADSNGVVDGTGSIATIYGKAPRTTFPVTTAQCLTGIAAPTATTVQVTDACTGLLVELTRAVAP